MNFVGDKYDNRYTSLVGWEQTANGAGYRYFFSAENMEFISGQITEKLRSFGLNIRVTDEVIGGVMSDIIRSQNPKIGDIHTRYIIPQEDPRNDAKSMTEQTINVIVNQILGEHDQACCNGKLSIWSSVLGDFNTHRLRSYSTIRKKNNDYIKGFFMENY